ncbi:hypothetical protein H9657_05345 [Cellulomonas sp. Sa3CUA2]|uniref:Uncharacterized protein n=1 Tax=Cellulomonas avistercoris TaxID=2762242 RepID=A0ABR8QBB2_9CELL|nr:hypothetical protein [Cellulomonas avistercoris]MBD7917705.1 hypothetical protein [Cellulomonas avistercoris]
MSAPERRARSGPAWWATLSDAAAADEIESNRRSERFVAFAGVAGAVVTGLVLLLVAVAR